APPRSFFSRTANRQPLVDVLFWRSPPCGGVDSKSRILWYQRCPQARNQNLFRNVTGQPRILEMRTPAINSARNPIVKPESQERMSAPAEERRRMGSPDGRAMRR